VSSPRFWAQPFPSYSGQELPERNPILRTEEPRSIGVGKTPAGLILIEEWPNCRWGTAS
jgi:hypothetical protein